MHLKSRQSGLLGVAKQPSEASQSKSCISAYILFLGPASDGNLTKAGWRGRGLGRFAAAAGLQLLELATVRPPGCESCAWRPCFIFRLACTGTGCHTHLGGAHCNPQAFWSWHIEGAYIGHLNHGQPIRIPGGILQIRVNEPSVLQLIRPG